jgi:chromosome condensin MukBEF ATPase and DNA-binding subunit MukB
VSRRQNPLIAVLLVAAVAVSIATVVCVVMLPEAGSVRHAAGTKGSALADLRASLNALGINQADGTIQHLLTRTPSALSFRGATYWTAAEVASRRDTYLEAGALLSVVLLFTAAVLVAADWRRAKADVRGSPGTRRAAA